MTGLTNTKRSTLEGVLRARDQALRIFIATRRWSPDTHYADVAGATHTASDESFADLTATLNQMNVSKATDELRDVDAALVRLRDGSYGICVDCGQDIGYERLLVAPEAQRCARCQAKVEDRHGGRDLTPSL